MNPIHICTNKETTSPTPVDQLSRLLELVSNDSDFTLLRATLELYTLEVLKGE